jgi:tetratricopeptide (TPR) repeat protein
MVRKHLDEQLDAVHRSRLHEATARALERLTEAHSAEVAEQLAFHYEAADIFGKAVRFRQLAAEAALERSEYQESFEQLRVGLALVPSMVDAHERLEAELQLQLDLNVALAVIYGRGAERRREACERAFELCQSVGAWSASFWTRYALADLAQCRADPAHAQELVEQLLALAHQGNESAMISLAEVSMAEAYFLSGNLLSAQRRLSCLLDSTVARGFARLRGKTGLDMGSVGLSWLAWTRWSLGYADQASALADQALVLAEEHPLSQAHVLLLDHFCLDWISRQFDQALQAAARFEQLVNDQKSLTSMRPWLNIVRGWTCCYQHSADSGLAAIRQGIAEMEPTGATLMRSLQLLILADACACAGDLVGGLRVVDEALSLMETTGLRHLGPALYHQNGELLFRLRAGGDRQTTPGARIVPEPEVALNVALTMARLQQAKMWELRASLTLCRLLLTQGRNDEARSLLAPLYAWFTEGFDLPDLRAARALLGQLD